MAEPDKTRIPKSDVPAVINYLTEMQHALTLASRAVSRTRNLADMEDGLDLLIQALNDLQELEHQMGLERPEERLIKDKDALIAQYDN